MPLGGGGEVGSKNMAILEYEGKAIMIDAGLMFANATHPGVDLLLPDFTEVVERKNYLQGIFLTHGHEDHIGSVPFILQKRNIPLFGTRLTLGFINAKLEEFSLPHAPQMNVVEPGEPLQVGPFKVEYLPVTHSIVDACSIAVTTPLGVVLHTGDFKIDPNPADGKRMALDRFAELGKKGVLLMMSDSTNVERQGTTGSEGDLAPVLEGYVAKAEGRVILTCFASNIQRVQMAVDAALKNGRRICVMGRSMVRNTEVARHLGYLRIPADRMVQPDHVRGVKARELMIITTGSQGEPMSSLSRMAMGDHRHVEINKGDLVIISARKIPGNERAASNVINHLFKRGAEVLYEDVAFVHVSGHAQRDEQKKLLELVKPRYFVPVHGEYRHLVFHKRLAVETGMDPRNIFLLENGDCLTLDKRSAEVEHGLPQGVLFVDGGSVQEVGEMVLRDRQHLAEDGVVVVLVSVDSAAGRIVGGPDLVIRGVSDNIPGEILEEARHLIRDMLEAESREAVSDWATVNEAVRKALQKFFSRKMSRRPMILPVIMEV